jgi:hypothetical protein
MKLIRVFGLSTCGKSRIEGHASIYVQACSMHIVGFF